MARALSDGDGRITGSDAIKFFALSNLPRPDLKQVFVLLSGHDSFASSTPFGWFIRNVFFLPPKCGDPLLFSLQSEDYVYPVKAQSVE